LNGKSVSDFRFIGIFASWLKLGSSGTLLFKDVPGVGFSYNNAWHVISTSGEEILYPLRLKEAKEEFQRENAEKEAREDLDRAKAYRSY